MDEAYAEDAEEEPEPYPYLSCTNLVSGFGERNATGGTYCWSVRLRRAAPSASGRGRAAAKPARKVEATRVEKTRIVNKNS